MSTPGKEVAVRDYVEVTTQKQLDAAIERGDFPICTGKGHFVVRGSAHVVARESAHVEAWESAHVEAWGSAHVEAWESAHVEARESAQVEAWGSAHVEARESAQVQASKYVGIHRFGKGPKVKGGVLIQVPEIKTMEDFCDWYGVEVKRGRAMLYKCVTDDFASGHGMIYQPDSTVACEDWNKRPSCGHGLHFSPRPTMARTYHLQGTRFVACKVKLADAVVITDFGQPDKIKVPSCEVLYECTELGERVEQKAAA